METWNNFFSSVASAAATLTGLIFVGVSLSLTRILAIPKMASRALSALILLVVALVISLIFLIPNLDIETKGIIILIATISTWVITLRLCLATLYNIHSEYKIYARYNLLLTQLSVLPCIAGAIIMITCGEAGIYWIISGIIFSIVKTVVDAWVLLIEIHK